ncbi:transforming growth factor-beta-induced protein ig-h3-like [Mytilus edulis]|uniref:transforming growth factor-beta-induced protein ig-h3-like n=1 Tax=Mytilus edulis TaxID=6550 RepID=UPI0039F09CD0
MSKIAIVVLILAVFLVIAIESGSRRRYRKNKHAPGFRRHVINDDDWEADSDDDDRPFRPSYRWSRRRPGNRRFQLGFNNRRRGYSFDFDFDFDFDFNFDQRKPWYEGPNICTYKDVIKNESSSDETEITSHHVIRSQVCDDKGSSYKCTNSMVVGGKEETIVEVKECCPGFTRKTNQIGCPTAVETKNLLEKAKDLDLTKFIEAIKIAGLEQDLKNGNITLFAPVDKSFDQMSDLLAPKSQITLQDTGVLMVSQPLIDTMISDLKAMLLGHLSPEVYTSSRLNDEQLIDTASPYKNKIRINFYDNELMTANCIKVKSRDAVATNGVINVVEEVLEPVSETLMEIISSDPEMSYMKTAIGRSGLGKMFRDEGQLTLFAPSDSAFRKLDPILLSRILDGDTECLIKLLKNHVLPNVICSQAIQGRSKSRNLLGHMLNLTRAADDKLFVNGAQSVDIDVMAINGVLYVIDDILVPDEALDVLEIARRSGASAIVKLIEDTGLAKTLQTTQNLTLFAPSDAAIGNLEKIPTDPTELMKLLSYHVVPSEEHTCRLYNDQQLDTLNNGKQIRFNEYTTPFPFARFDWKWVQTAQCATIEKSNIRACNGIIHIVDKVLQPPAGTLLDVLALDNRFTELVQLIKIAEIGDMLEGDGPFTLFAPTDDAFKRIDDAELQNIVNDKGKLKHVLFNHIFKDQICCSGLSIVAANVGYGARQLKSMSEERFTVDEMGSKTEIGGSQITECDKSSTNGVIHVLDEVILKQKRKFMGDDDFWDWFRF